MTATATYLGANGWCLDVAGFRVLVDPWLVGPLVFPPGPWLLKGEMPTMQPVPECIDLLLLTQGLQDHAHPETLSMLSKDLPVVGSAAAAKVAKRLGYGTSFDWQGPAEVFSEYAALTAFDHPASEQAMSERVRL